MFTKEELQQKTKEELIEIMLKTLDELEKVEEELQNLEETCSEIYY
jgi:hypothetical protein